MLGQGSSIALADALQSSMLALNMAPPTTVAKKAMHRLDYRVTYARMNARHCQHLAVSALSAGLSVHHEKGNFDKAELMDGEEVLLTLEVDRTANVFWQKQTDVLRAQKWYRDDRLGEIVLQQSDILSFLGLAVPLSAQSHPMTAMLLDIVQDIAFSIGAKFKDVFAMPRPEVIAPDIAPIIQTPAHSAFPAGHAIEAFSAAKILGALYPDRYPNLRLLAARVAENRSFAGVHYPIDSHAGAILGDILGQVILGRLFQSGFKTPKALVHFKTEDHVGKGAPHYSSVAEYALHHTRIDRIASSEGKVEILDWLAGEVMSEMDR